MCSSDFYRSMHARKAKTASCLCNCCLFSLMQRRYSEPNTYIDSLPSISLNSDELYDDVASIADPEVRATPRLVVKGLTLQTIYSL